MKKIIAQCNTNLNEQLDLKYLKELLPEYDVIYGPEALELVNSGKVSAKDVFIIQECNSKIARKLRKKGAVAFINYCLESQIYAYVFYSKLKNIAPKFKYRVYFKGMFKGLEKCEESNNFNAYYPGISDFEPELINWEDRDFVSMVVGNKYVEQKNVFPELTFRIDKYFKWFFRLFFETKTQKFLRENERQNKRYEIIEYFGQKELLKMYGRGWDNFKEIPSAWRNKLESVIKKISPQPVKNKLEVVSKCKFNLAIENLSYPGYVTEKILEAMIAKSIPVYLGAPDITDYVLKGCFIDIRDFKNLDALYEYMKNMTSEQAQRYFDCAQEFLTSEENQKYTEYGFSKLLADLVKSAEQ